MDRTEATLDRTEATLRKLFAALPAPGVLSVGAMYRVEAAPESRILRMLPYLKYRNATGAHIYLRPTGESPGTLLDDLTAASLPRLTAEGYAPAAVIESQPRQLSGLATPPAAAFKRAWNP